MKITLVLLVMILSSMVVLTPTITYAFENKLLFPKSMFPQSDAYKDGWTAGFLGQSFKGHHTQDYVNGFLNGTSTYVYNYNDTGGGHSMSWYIGYHNGAAIIDDQYQNGNMSSYPGCHDDKDYCDGFKKGWQTDANALG